MLVKADLHIHSTFSDGRASPKEILLRAKAAGIEVVSITDHDTFNGGIRAHDLSRNSPGLPLAIIGVEVATDKGDILVYCLKPFELAKSIGVLLDRARENNCLVAPAHPFDKWRNGIGEEIGSYRWDAVEAWNARAPKWSNLEAMSFAKERGLPALANSDAHILDEVGAAYSTIEIADYRVEEVLEAILKGRVKPVPGRPGFSTSLKKLAWSVERRIKHSDGPSGSGNVD